MPLIRKPSHARLAGGVFCVLLFLNGIVQSAVDIGAPPASFILDDAILFQKDDADKLSRELTESANKHGVSVYVAGFSFLEGEAARERANALCARWLDGRPGFVIVYTRGNAQPAVMASPVMWQRYPADEVMIVLQESGRLLSDVFLSPEQRVIRAAELALKKIQLMEDGRLGRLHQLSTPDTRLAMLLGAMFSLLGAISWFSIWMRRKRAAARSGPFFFPEAVVGTRLGAPFGGGVTGEAGPGQKH